MVPLQEVTLRDHDVIITTELDEVEEANQGKGKKNLMDLGGALVKKKDPTKKEHVYKLLTPTFHPNDKWFCPRATVWMEWAFKTPYDLRAYGLRSANDWEDRNPKGWTLYYKETPEDEEWKVAHTMDETDQAGFFSDYWQLKIFYFDCGLVSVSNLKLDITRNCGSDCFQLGQMVVY